MVFFFKDTDARFRNHRMKQAGQIIVPSIDTIDQTAIKQRLIEQVQHEDIRLTLHAHQEMAEDNISYDALQEALITPFKRRER